MDSLCKRQNSLNALFTHCSQVPRHYSHIKKLFCYSVFNFSKNKLYPNKFYLAPLIFFFFWLNKRFEVKLSPISKTNWHLDSWSNNKSNHCIVDVIGLNSVISIKKENFYCVSYQQLDATYKDIIKLTDS